MTHPGSGKFWHRHRRPRPVEYNTDPEFHTNFKRESEIAKTMAKKKGGAALRAQSNTVPNTPADGPSEPQTPSRLKDDAPRKPSPKPPILDDERPVSPVTTASSGSEPPLSQKVKVNGIVRVQSPSPDAPPPPPAPPTPKNEPPASEAPPTLPDPPSSPPRAWVSVSGLKNCACNHNSDMYTFQPPQWLSNAMHTTQGKYPHDKFEVALRRVTATSAAEWRIKCIDCPGKVRKGSSFMTLPLSLCSSCISPVPGRRCRILRSTSRTDSIVSE